MNYRIGAWCAVSSKPQAGEEKESLPYQLEQAREFARAVGGEVVRTYMVPGHTRDYWAWHEAEREVPAYAEVRADLEAGKLDIVHCIDADRLGRDPALISQFYSLAERHDCEIYDASMPHQLGQQSMGHRYGTAVKAVAAGEDQRRRVARHRMGMRKRARRGLQATGRWPLGYTPTEDGAEFNDDIGAVQMITRLFLAGHSYTRILEEMVRSAWTLEDGKPWYPTRIWRIVNSDVYAGFTEWGGARNEEPSEQFPALWDEETYQAVLRERARRSRGGHTQLGGPFSSGVAICARCGWRMHRARARRQDAYYLRCGKHSQSRIRRELSGGCHPNYLLESEVIAALGSWLARFSSPADLAEALGEDTGLAELEHEQARAEHRLEEIGKERKRLARALARGSLDLELHAEVDGELLDERNNLEIRQRELVAQIHNRPDPAERIRWLEQLTGSDWRHLERLDDERLGQALRGAGIRVLCEEGSVKLIGFSPE